jgi:hypothetical protein
MGTALSKQKTFEFGPLNQSIVDRFGHRVTRATTVPSDEKLRAQLGQHWR